MVSANDRAAREWISYSFSMLQIARAQSSTSWKINMPAPGVMTVLVPSCPRCHSTNVSFRRVISAHEEIYEVLVQNPCRCPITILVQTRNTRTVNYIIRHNIVKAAQGVSIAIGDDGILRRIRLMGPARHRHRHQCEHDSSVSGATVGDTVAVGFFPACPAGACSPDLSRQPTRSP